MSIQAAKPILDVQIDTGHSILYLVLDNLKKGKPFKESVVVSYDLKAKTELWSKEFELKDKIFRLLDTIPSLSEESDNTQVFDWRDGQFLREYEGSILFLADEGKIGVANFKTISYEWLVGVNMLSGKLIWDYKTQLEMDKVDMLFIGDTSIAFVDHGIHYLNLKTDKKEYMNDYIIKENSFLCALNERMLEVDDSTFRVMNEHVFNTGSANLGLRNIVNPPYYLKNENGFFNPLYANPNILYIENSAGLKIEFSEDYELKSVVKKNDFYKMILKVGNYELITNETDYFLIDSEGNQIDNLTYTLSARILDGYFIDFTEKELIMIPVSEIWNMD